MLLMSSSPPFFFYQTNVDISLDVLFGGGVGRVGMGRAAESRSVVRSSLGVLFVQERIRTRPRLDSTELDWVRVSGSWAYAQNCNCVLMWWVCCLPGR